MAKPRKVKKTEAMSGTTDPPALKTADSNKPVVRYIPDEEARVITEKIMRVHHDLFRRLAEYDRS